MISHCYGMGWRCAFFGVLVFLAACKTPVGVQQVAPNRVYAQVNANVLTSGELSWGTSSVLHRYNLEAQFARDPLGVIQLLDETARKDRRRDILFALSELSLAAAERERQGRLERQARADAGTRHSARERDLLAQAVAPPDPAAQPYYLASAVYAYLYLFGQFEGPLPSAFDRQFRLACDLYCRGLTEALQGPKRLTRPGSKRWSAPCPWDDCACG